MESHAGFPQCNDQNYLPIELVTEVCVRLPVKSLLRFRCVCKSWCSLISSSKFVSLHLACYHNDDDDDNDDDTPYLASDFKGKTWLLLLRHNRMCHERITYRDHFHFLHRGPSVNGLLLRATLGLFSYTKQTDSIVLWNPSIRKVRQLPPLGVDHRVYFGLGYSRSSNDYKVVAIATNVRNSVQIYTLSNPKWRRLDYYREDIIRGVDSDGVFIDGYIYWISTRNSIISFDVNDEVFNYMLLPMEQGSYDEYLWRYPIVHRGLLGLLELCSQGTCSLWVMTNNDQVFDSWSKLYTIHFQAENHPWSILYFMNGKMIFVKKNGVLTLYDFDSKELRNLLQSRGGSRICYLSLYKESLVLL